MTNPQIRALYAEAKRKASEAAALLGGDNPSSEAEARAKELLAEANQAEERAKALQQAERLLSNADDIEKVEREELRKKAEVSAGKQHARGSRGTAQTDDSEDDEQRDEIQVGDAELRSFAEFTKAFGDWIQDQRSRHSPENSQRLKAFRAALILGGPHKLKPEYRKLLETATIETDGEQWRAMGIEQQASLGILVPDEVQREIRMAQLAFGGFRSTRTQFLTTSSGRPIPTPTVDDTSNEGSYRGESTSISAGTDVVAQPNELNAYSMTSGVLKVSWELAQDESFGLESFLTQLGTIRNERRFQRALTTGTGTSQPAGLMTSITAGNTAANTNKFINDDFYQLKHGSSGVDSAYHAQAEFMLSNNALLNLKLMQGGIGQGLWQAGLGASAPPTIDGDPYAVNYHMDTVATGNAPVAYGDFSWMYSREVVPMVVLVLRERYADEGNIGYIFATRNDGREVNPGVPALKKMTMA